MLEPGLSSVVTYKPDGTNARHLGALGHVEQLSMSWSLPGGPDQMSCLLQQPPDWRSDAMNVNRIVKVFRGGDVVWDGTLQEPISGPTGWSIAGNGVGNHGTNFRGFYTSVWGSAGSQNDAVNQAITRGLRWSNPGLPSSVWFGQVIDPAADTLTDILNLFATKGQMTWQVKCLPNGAPGQNINQLKMFTVPTNASTPTRILTSATPVNRSIGGYVTRLYIRYQSSPDGATAATFATTSVTNAAQLAAHGALEEFIDLSSAGQLTATQAQNVGNAILARYQAASFQGPFTIHYGELLTLGGQPMDLGIDHSGQVAKMILTDFGYGGEVVPDPVIFVIGAYSYDDTSQTAQVTPFQSLDLSISGLLSMLSTVLQHDGQATHHKKHKHGHVHHKKHHHVRHRHRKDVDPKPPTDVDPKTRPHPPTHHMTQEDIAWVQKGVRLDPENRMSDRDVEWVQRAVRHDPTAENS